MLDNQVQEILTLDYKRELPDLANDQKKLAMLKDICSFSNTHGGQIIYGIEEEAEKGTPSTITGIKIPRPDDERLRIINTIKTSLEPRVSGIKIEPFRHNKEPDTYIVVIKVPSS